MSLFDRRDVVESDVLVRFADHRQAGKVLRRPSLILAANLARTVFLADQARRQIEAFRVNATGQFVEAETQALDLIGADFDLQLLFRQAHDIDLVDTGRQQLAFETSRERAQLVDFLGSGNQ